MRTSKVPYAQFMEEVLTIYALDRRTKTIAKMRQVLREIGAFVTFTADLKPATIADWRNAYPDRRASTVDSLMRSLRSAFEIGVASGYFPSSPLAVKQLWPDLDDDEDDDEPSHHPIADIRAVLTHLQVQAPLSWHAHRLFALATTVALTGVRRSEALNLTIPDVDFETKTLRIMTKRARRVPRQSAKAKPKTKASVAPVGMPEELVPILRTWVPCTGATWLFPGATRQGPWTGGPPGQKPLDRLKAEAEAVGVHGFTFLSLRHSWATHGEFFGLGDTMIQRQLRHTTKKTQKVYRHPDVVNIATSVRSISYLAPHAAQAQSQA